MNISGIYKIQSIKKKARCYIGSAVNISSRWSKHLSDLKKNKHHSIKLQRHFNKYGESDLQFSILLGCDKNDLLKIEQYFIDSYKPYFNICPTAGSQLGREVSDKTREKNSKSHLGKIPWNKNKTGLLTDTTRQNISKSLTGKKQSKETVQKRIESVKKAWELKRQNGTAFGNIPWNKGKKGIYSEVTLNKLRDSRKSQIFTQEMQNKKSESMKKTLALKRLTYINQN